jgi:hypothetical protein
MRESRDQRPPPLKLKQPGSKCYSKNIKTPSSTLFHGCDCLLNNSEALVACVAIMAEAIGLVASVVQLAGTGLKLSQALYQYADGVATADRRIQDIAKEIRLTSFVIEELGSIFKKDDTLSLISVSAVATANETLKECSAVFEEIEATLNKSRKGKIGRLMLPFRESKIELLRSHIDKLKSTLQLLMQVLMHAYQVSSNRLDREAEAKQRDEIRRLLENKKNKTKRYEESLRRFMTNDSGTEVEDDGLSIDDNGSVSTLVTKTIGSSMDPDSLAECVQHVWALLKNLERLKRALANQSEGDDHSEHHQMAIGSYFAARSHLDSVLLGSSNMANLKGTMMNTKEHINKEAPITIYDTTNRVIEKETQKFFVAGASWKKPEEIVVRGKPSTARQEREKLEQERERPDRERERLERERERLEQERTRVRAPTEAHNSGNASKAVQEPLFGSSKPSYTESDDHSRFGTNPFAPSSSSANMTQSQTFTFGSITSCSYHYSTSHESAEPLTPVPPLLASTPALPPSPPAPRFEQQNEQGITLTKVFSHHPGKHLCPFPQSRN